MKNELPYPKEQWIQALLRFKGLMTTFPTSILPQAKKLDINMIELAIMKGIEKNALGSADNVYMHDIQKQLFITKAAISQTLRVLEKKGYIDRDVDRNNRRKTIVTLTPKGRDVLKYGNEAFDDMLNEILIVISKNDLELFIKNINMLADSIERIISKP